jgi:hypothetical protein
MSKRATRRDSWRSETVHPLNTTYSGPLYWPEQGRGGRNPGRGISVPYIERHREEERGGSTGMPRRVPENRRQDTATCNSNEVNQKPSESGRPITCGTGSSKTKLGNKLDNNIVNLQNVIIATEKTNKITSMAAPKSRVNPRLNRPAAPAFRSEIPSAQGLPPCCTA